MLLLTISEFRANESTYLKMALTEKIAIQSEECIFNITPNTEVCALNPSPTNDSWYDDPKNLEHLNKAIEAAHIEGAK